MCETCVALEVELLPLSRDQLVKDVEDWAEGCRFERHSGQHMARVKNQPHQANSLLGEAAWFLPLPWWSKCLAQPICFGGDSQLKRTELFDLVVPVCLCRLER